MKIIIANSKGGTGKSTLTMALADIIKDVQIIDTDIQGTIKTSSKFTNRHVPIEPEKISSEFVIYDTPPYHSEELRSLLREADLVIIPTKIAYPDLLAIKGVIDDLRDLKMTDKAIIVFNEIRKPHNKTYHEIKELFNNNYKDIKKAETELSNLVSFQRILSEQLYGQAEKEVKSLATELNLTY